MQHLIDENKNKDIYNVTKTFLFNINSVSIHYNMCHSFYKNIKRQ